MSYCMEAQVMANGSALCTFQVVSKEGGYVTPSELSERQRRAERESKHDHYTKSFSTKPQAPCRCTFH